MARNLRAWTIDGAKDLLGDEPAATIITAVDEINAQLAPVPADGKWRADWNKALDERLRRLAVKIAPGMSLPQGEEWRKVMVEALSDLPALIVLTAAKSAIHRPMQYLNQVETIVRDIAAELIGRRRLALARLDRLREELARADAPAIAAQPRGPITVDELRRWSRHMRSLAVLHGWVTQAMADEADATDDRRGLDVPANARADDPRPIGEALPLGDLLDRAA